MLYGVVSIFLSVENNNSERIIRRKMSKSSNMKYLKNIDIKLWDIYNNINKGGI